MVMGPGRAVLFYGRHSLAEGLSSGKFRGTTFMLTGAGTWVGKPAYLAVDPLTIQKGWWEITQAITKWWIKVQCPGHSCMNPSTPQLFRFDQQGGSPQKDTQERPLQTTSYHLNSLWGARTTINVEEIRDYHHLSPLTIPGSWFESDRSLVSTASLMSSLSDRSEGSWHPQQGKWCGKAWAHMTIDLLIFKDEDAKDAVTYQSWRWDLMVYSHAGCRDYTLLPYAIWSLQGYPGELV